MDKKIIGSWLVAVSGLAFATAATAADAAAENYPTRPITMIVPFPAGGGSDNVARLVAKHLADEIGHTVVVENRGGAGGNIGTRLIAQAKPDGYTIGLATPGPVSVGKSLYKNLPYNPAKDFEPIILLNESPLVMAMNPDLGVKNFEMLKPWLKGLGREANAAIGGTGSVNHLMTELYRQESDDRLLNVPYKGGSEAVTDTMAGHTDMLFIPMSAILAPVKADQLVPIFLTAENRSDLLPGVPTAAEVGLPNVVGSAWNGIVTPKGTPAAIVDKLNAALNTVLKKPETLEAFDTQGMVAKGGTAADFQAFIKADAKKWQAVIENSDIEKI